MTSYFQTLYDSARYAYFGFSSNATEAHWVHSCGRNPTVHSVTRDELFNLAGTCRAGACNSAGKFDADDIEQFCYAAGFFEALLWERFGEMVEIA